MLPLTAGFLISGPLSGILSDRFGARPFATGGMVVAAASFGLLEMLPVNFVYWQFAGILLLNGIGMGLFASPNRAGIMNSLPPERRGVGAGMSATFQNSAMVLSIGIFFTLIILGLASSLPATLSHGLIARFAGDRERNDFYGRDHLAVDHRLERRQCRQRHRFVDAVEPVDGVFVHDQHAGALRE